MVDIIRCKNQIGNLFENQPALQYRFSSFTRQAWGENKEFCLNAFGSTVEIKNFLLNPGNFEFTSDTHGSADQQSDAITNTGSDSAVLTGTLQEPTGIGNFQAQAGEIFSFLWMSLLWIIVIVSLFKLIKYLMVFMYDVFNASRVEYLKVVMPRSDSKADREKQKELAKDMKEQISRMSQVFSSIHKLGELSVVDNVLRKFFDKPKITFMMHYENGLMNFIIGTYPEYRKIVESALAAQYSESSLQTIKKPNFLPKKHYDLMPLQPEKEGAYPLRMFKQMEDDPMNNIIDAIAKVNPDDTFTTIMTIRPEKGAFNKRAQKFAEALYKKDESVTKKKSFLASLLPWNLFSFLISGPSEKLIQKFSGNKERGDPMIRMVKAEEEALNNMAEEAGKKAYASGLLLATSSDDADRAQSNIYNLVSAFTIYSDEYNNALDQPENIADLLGPIIKPIWKASITFLLPAFFYKQNIFTVNELSSLYHLPDATYNRSPIITWMDYKTLAGPNNLPVLKEENEGFFITGIIAESFKGGNISKIIKGMQHPSVGIKEEEKEIKEQVDAAYEPKEGESVVEEEGVHYVLRKSVKKLPAFKTYKDGVLLGINVYRNKYSPIYMKKKDRTRHHYVIGKSGTGKSVYIAMIARQDIWAGAGVCVIDPHGDLVEGILEYVPKHRAKDIVYFDAGNEQRPMGLNLYQISDFSEADRVVNDAVEIFIKMFGAEIFGPRIQEYFKYGSLTLLEDMEDKATLIDVPRLFTDEAFRDYKTAKVKNPVVRNFWDKTYNAMGDREKQEIIPYFTSKFVSFITNSLIRNIIGQTESAFNFREVMDNRKILLINLSKGKIGELNAKLLGMIIVSKIYNAAMGRADMEEKDREFFYLYVDEFQNFVTDTFADILSEARKYKLCLIMAHQFIAQLDGGGEGGKEGKVKDAVFGNVGTMQSFKVGAPDAEFLEKEYAPVLGAQDILGIANYKAYIKLNINNTTTRVFSMNSIWTEDYKNKRVANILKQYSEKKYGRKKEFVDAEITARLGILSDDAEIPGVDPSENPSENPPE